MAKIILYKRDDGDDDEPRMKLFDEIMHPIIKADPVQEGKVAHLVGLICQSNRHLSPARAARWLMHTPQGRELLNLTINKTETKEIPMLDVQKLIPLVEDALMAQARLGRQPGETTAKTFAKLYENDIDFRKQWAIVQEAKHLLALGYSKAMATLTPTETGIDDGGLKATQLLTAMAAKNGRKFEEEFADPANADLAAQTYAGWHSAGDNRGAYTGPRAPSTAPRNG
jgi:hypothetical protein